MYDRAETERYMRMKLNGMLPDDADKIKNEKNDILKKSDCIEHMTKMFANFKSGLKDTKDHPIQPSEVPNALNQKVEVIERMKERREDLQTLQKNMKI